MEYTVQLSGEELEESSSSFLFFDEKEKKFKLHVTNGEDYVTVDLSIRDPERAREIVEWVSLITGDF